MMKQVVESMMASSRHLSLVIHGSLIPLITNHSFKRPKWRPTPPTPHGYLNLRNTGGKSPALSRETQCVHKP